MAAQADPTAAEAILRLEIVTSPGVVDIRLVGEMDMSTRGSLEEALSSSLVDGATHVRLDLRELTFCDATGVAELIGAHGAATRQDRSLSAHGATPQVRRVLDLTGTMFILGAEDGEPTGGAAPEALTESRVALP